MTALARVALGAALSVVVPLVAYAPGPARAALDLPVTKAEMTALGPAQKTAWDLLKTQRLRGDQLPDWSGTYTHIVAQVWVYAPPALVEPWYVKETYAKLADEDRELRISYWGCREHQNNDVVQTDTGSSPFRDFTFDKATPKPPPPAQSR